MDLQSIGQAAIPATTAVAGLLTATATLRKGSSIRAGLQSDVETLSKLDKESDAYAALAKHVEWQIHKLRTYESVAKREVAIGIFALVCAVALTVLSSWLVVEGGWWYLGLALSLPLTLVFMYGTYESFTKAPRDDKGSAGSQAP